MSIVKVYGVWMNITANFVKSNTSPPENKTIYESSKVLLKTSDKENGG